MKINKTSRFIGSLTLLAGLTITSCDKEFLEVPPQGQISEEAIKTDPNAVQDLVNGVYNIMWLGGFGPDVHSLQYVILTNIISDDADKGSTPQDYAPALEIDEFTFGPSNSIVNNVWTGYYQAVARANQALERIPLSPLSDEEKAVLEGEVRFLRGYFYFNLVRFFGGVPLINRVPSPDEVNSEEFQTRASADEIYSLIISDLQFAVDNLPPKGAPDSQIGRATQGAAQSLLAKVYMYRGDWQQVFDLTNAVMASGLYALVPDYENIWREVGKNNEESIFEVQTGTNANCDAAINLYVVCQGPRAGGAGGWRDLGFGFNTPTEDLVNSYEPGDVRKNATIIFINPTPQGTVLYDGFRIPSQDSVENSRYNYKAYHSRTAENNCGSNDRLPENLRVLRYADVLLMNAEAANALGQSAVALEKLNQVRVRAGLPAATATAQAAIWQERRVELAMEHDRFFDLVRQGRAGEVLRAKGKPFVDGKHEVLPIPQQQIDLSGGMLTQNPGY